MEVTPENPENRDLKNPEKTYKNRRSRILGKRDFKSLVSTDSTTAACLQLCILPCSPSIVKWKSERVFH